MKSSSNQKSDARKLQSKQEPQQSTKSADTKTSTAKASLSKPVSTKKK